jgi:hypothetical protein
MNIVTRSLPSLYLQKALELSRSGNPKVAGLVTFGNLLLIPDYPAEPVIGGHRL